MGIRCPECGAEADEEARFCSQCGSGLRPSRSGSPRVPEPLAERMRAEGARMGGERKLVSVVFADVAGSMELAEQVDPERWREIMAGLSERLGAAVHGYEGTVDKFTGDGIMALFGAPIAHEDHARRACLAALEMQEAMGAYVDEVRRTDGISLALRIGINSGEVVVGGIGEDLGLDYTAVGHTVGLAQRMEALADPGSAFATEHTQRLAEGLIEFGDLGEFRIKGSQRRLGVYRVIGEGAAAGRFDVSRSRGLSRFVGRQTEMERLVSALERAINGEGQVIGIVAQAGTGKSRLCHELRRVAEGQGVPVYGTACQAHAKRIPLRPVLQMLRSYFGIEPSDDEQVAREKTAGRLLLLDPSFEDDLPVLFDFLAIPDPARPAPQLSEDARKQRLLGLVSRVMAARGEVQAGVNIVEDLHWIDDASEEFLLGLVEATPASRTLTIVNYRPEYEPAWLDREGCTELRLEPLGEDAVAELLVALLGPDPSLDGLGEQIIARTGGNPFFVEETVRSLSESGILEGRRGEYRLTAELEEIEVPATVQAILAARIDRLQPAAKALLHTAAAIGGRFRRTLLARAADVSAAEAEIALGELTRAEFVAPTGAGGGEEFEFVHPVTLEVAYGEQLGPERRGRHRAIAEALIETSADRPAQHASEIAHHFEEAGEHLAAARWHAAAAEHLRYSNARAAAAELLRIRALAPRLPADEESRGLELMASVGLLRAAWRSGSVGMDELAAIYERALELSRTADNPVMEAIAHNQWGLALGICRGEVGTYYELTCKAFDLLERSGEISNTTVQVIANVSIPYAAFMTGRHQESLTHLEQVLRLTDEDPDLGLGYVLQDPRSFAMGMRALPLMGLGRFAEAHDAALAGIELARERDRETLAWSHSFAGSVYAWGGFSDLEPGRQHLQEAIAIGVEMGQVQARLVGMAFLGPLSLRAGDVSRAEQELLEARDAIRSESVVAEFEPYLAAAFATLRLRQGRTEEAIAEAEEGRRAALAKGNRAFLTIATVSLARSLIAAGGAAEVRAEELIAELELEPDGRSGFTRASIGQVRAALLLARGERAAATAELGAAIATARQIGAAGTAAELEAELAAA